MGRITPLLPDDGDVNSFLDNDYLRCAAVTTWFIFCTRITMSEGEQDSAAHKKRRLQGACDECK
jgi:hypothetical protein